jgi:hypothetical protein
MDDIKRWTQKKEQLRRIVDQLRLTRSRDDLALLEDQLTSIEEHIRALERRRR